MKIDKLIQIAKKICDPRRAWGNIRHNFEAILIIGLITILCGGKDFVDMEVLGKSKYEWLSQFLKLPNGIPDSDTFRRVFELIDSNELARCLEEWIEDYHTTNAVSLDGKTIRGSSNAEHNAYHVVSAWASERGITLGQLVVDEKSNEIKAIPLLLDAIDICNAVVTIDAMGCQTAIASAIIGKGADYILALKGNHKNLYKEVKEYFKKVDDGNSEICLDEWVDESSSGNRIEKRTISIISADLVNGNDNWQSLQTIIRCRYICLKNGNESVVDRYFLSSLPANARRIGRIIRGHWSIENQLHWVLDVVFEEDDSRVRKDNAPLNMNILRKTALSLLLKVKQRVRLSFKKMMFRAALENNFLELVLLSE